MEEIAISLSETKGSWDHTLLEKYLVHGNQEVKAIVCVAHNEKQCGSPVSQGIQFQLIVGRDLPQLRNVEHGKARTAGNQDTLGGFARDKLSRTF